MILVMIVYYSILYNHYIYIYYITNPMSSISILRKGRPKNLQTHTPKKPFCV